MGLRPGRVVRKIERPWTRVSHHKPRRSYVKGVPFPKTHQFEMGNKTGKFNTVINLQVKNAVQYLRDRGISRQKDDSRTQASKFLPRSYYEDMVKEAGFKLVEAKEFAVDMKREAWEYISSFQQYAAGALRGYPVDEAVKAMKAAVQPALEQHGERDKDGNLYITRKWLAISTEA